MRRSSAVVLVLLAACGSKSDPTGTPTGTLATGAGSLLSGTTSYVPDACTVEADLATEQTALGLTVPSVCADMTDLGAQTLVEAGVVPSDVDFATLLPAEAQAHRSELEGTRRLFAYDGVTISVPEGGIEGLELAVLSAQALSIWSSDFPASASILDEMRGEPTEAALPCCDWKNTFGDVVVSLDQTPRDIGASVSVLGATSTTGSTQHFTNTALISIDRETTRGADTLVGSRVIYGAADDRENQLRYFADGAVFTLAHEATHLYIDHRNSVSEVANRIYTGRGYVNDAYVSAEEVIANFSACEPLKAGLTSDMVTANQAIQANLRSLVGTDARLDELRLLDNAASSRIVLTATAACGG